MHLYKKLSAALESLNDVLDLRMVEFPSKMIHSSDSPASWHTEERDFHVSASGNISSDRQSTGCSIWMFRNKHSYGSSLKIEVFVSVASQQLALSITETLSKHNKYFTGSQTTLSTGVCFIILK
jgi:hypothetical protein